MIDDFALNICQPYSTGVYIAANAIPDSYAVIDAPDCALNKATYISGNHDLNSSLLSDSGFDRIVPTGYSVRTIPLPREEQLKKLLREVASRNDCGAILLSSLPMADITGVQYDAIIRSVAGDIGKPIVTVRRKLIDDDWLRGYSDTLEEIAKIIDLDSSIPPDPNNVAIVGYLMDRNEEDHAGNIRELRRLLEGIGLNLVSIWLSGVNYESLKTAGSAGTIIALPHGEKAAARIAARTGVKLVSAGIPFGLGGTERWLRTVAEATDCSQEANDFIEAELRVHVPKLEWIVPKLFSGGRFAFLGDPHMIGPFAELIRELGGETVLAAGMGTLPSDAALDIPVLMSNPRIPDLMREIESAEAKKPLNLFVANSIFRKFAEIDGSRAIEFGFPSPFHHALYDSPFLGFRGCMSFIGRMADKLAFNIS